MFQFLADENLNGDIVRGLSLRRVDADIVNAVDAGLSGTSDATVLEWAAAQRRIVLTHDRATMPSFALQRVTRGLDMPGIFVMSDRVSVGRAIQEIATIVECTKPDEWQDFIAFLPL